MKQVIIFGGAFNPPSRGHVWILGRCAQIARASGAEIWIIPSGERRDKYIGVSRQTRVELCEAMQADAQIEPGLARIITTELDRAKLVETIDTVRELTRQYPDYHFRWVFGADSYATMRQWRGGDWLAEHLDMLIVTRNGLPIETRQNVEILHGINDDISSTQIRTVYAKGDDAGSMVTPRVKDLLMAREIRYTEGE